jgi:hypothetical protein
MRQRSAGICRVAGPLLRYLHGIWSRLSAIDAAHSWTGCRDVADAGPRPTSHRRPRSSIPPTGSSLPSRHGSKALPFRNCLRHRSGGRILPFRSSSRHPLGGRILRLRNPYLPGGRILRLRSPRPLGGRTPRFRRPRRLPGDRAPPFRSSPHRQTGSKILRTGSSTRRPRGPNPLPVTSFRRLTPPIIRFRCATPPATSPRSTTPPAGSGPRSPWSPRSRRGSRGPLRPHGRSPSREIGRHRPSRSGRKVGGQKKDAGCGP